MTRYAIILLCFMAATAAHAQEERAASGLIGPRDTIDVRVFREDDLRTSAQLSSQGTITLPFIGAVRVLGLTTEQAGVLIAERYRDGWLVNPQVNVTIRERVRHSITVLGQVREPGVFNLSADRSLTLTEAIGMAGGLTRIAQSKKIALRSGKRGATSIINFKDITSGKSPDVILRDGDVINVPEGLF